MMYDKSEEISVIHNKPDNCKTIQSDLLKFAEDKIKNKTRMDLGAGYVQGNPFTVERRISCLKKHMSRIKTDIHRTIKGIFPNDYITCRQPKSY